MSGDTCERRAWRKRWNEKIKKDAEMYVLKEGALFDKDTGIRVVMELEHFEEIVEAVHKDLGHYGKKQPSTASQTDTSSPQTSGAKAPKNSMPACLASSTNRLPRRRQSRMRRFIHMAKSAHLNSSSWTGLEPHRDPKGQQIPPHSCRPLRPQRLTRWRIQNDQALRLWI